MREQRGLFKVCIRAIMTVVSRLSSVIGYYLFVHAVSYSRSRRSRAAARFEFEHTGAWSLPPPEFASLPDGTMKRSFDAFEYTYPAGGYSLEE